MQDGSLVRFSESPWIGLREVVYGGHKVICDAIASVNDGLSMAHPSWWSRDDQFMMAFVVRFDDQTVLLVQNQINSFEIIVDESALYICDI